jgi:hypothetical protein
MTRGRLTRAAVALVAVATVAYVFAVTVGGLAPR